MGHVVDLYCAGDVPVCCQQLQVWTRRCPLTASAAASAYHSHTTSLSSTKHALLVSKATHCIAHYQEKVTHSNINKQFYSHTTLLTSTKHALSVRKATHCTNNRFNTPDRIRQRYIHLKRINEQALWTFVGSRCYVSGRCGGIVSVCNYSAEHLLCTTVLILVLAFVCLQLACRHP